MRKCKPTQPPISLALPERTADRVTLRVVVAPPLELVPATSCALPARTLERVARPPALVPVDAFPPLLLLPPSLLTAPPLDEDDPLLRLLLRTTPDAHHPIVEN